MNGIIVRQAGICLPAAKPDQAAVVHARRNRSWMSAGRASATVEHPVAFRAEALHLAAATRAARIAPPKAAAVAPAPQRFPVLFRSSRS